MIRRLASWCILLGAASGVWGQTMGGTQGFGGGSQNTFTGSSGGINSGSNLNSTGGRPTTGFGTGSASTFSSDTLMAAPSGEFQNSGLAGTFIGANANAQQGTFVGRGLQQGFQQGVAGGAQNARGQFGNAGGFGAQGQRGQQGMGNRGQNMGRAASTRVIRTKLTVAFDYANMEVPAIRQNLTTQFAQMERFQLPGASSVTVSLQGREATLTGQVDSERDRELAIRIAKFEPGISSVKDELVVTGLPR